MHFKGSVLHRGVILPDFSEGKDPGGPLCRACEGYGQRICGLAPTVVLFGHFPNIYGLLVDGDFLLSHLSEG